MFVKNILGVDRKIFSWDEVKDFQDVFEGSWELEKGFLDFLGFLFESDFSNPNFAGAFSAIFCSQGDYIGYQPGMANLETKQIFSDGFRGIGSILSYIGGTGLPDEGNFYLFHLDLGPGQPYRPFINPVLDKFAAKGWVPFIQEWDTQ